MVDATSCVRFCILLFRTHSRFWEHPRPVALLFMDKAVDHPCANRGLGRFKKTAQAESLPQGGLGVFGGPGSDRAQKITGRRQVRVGPAVPSQATGKRTYAKKRDAVFANATPPPKAPVYAVRDLHSHRPHAPTHGRKHIASANTKSILFPHDLETACRDKSVKERFAKCAWLTTADKPDKFKATPASARQLGMSAQPEARRGGKRQIVITM